MYQLTWTDKATWQHQAGEVDASPRPENRSVEAAALLFWEEHCVECAAPDCYASCPLYVSRRDRKCARFEYGVYPNDRFEGLFGYGADVRFRRWAKLQSAWPGKARMFGIRSLRRQESAISRMESLVSSAATAFQFASKRRRLNGAFTWLRRDYVRLRSRTGSPSEAMPDALYLQFFSPHEERLSLIVEVTTDRPAYRERIPVQPGWNEYVIEYDRIRQQTQGGNGTIALTVDGDVEARFIFTWLDLVRFSRGAARITGGPPVPAEKVKCVAWDLDHTLWTGVIGDDGAEGVTPSSDALELVRRLDQRGILQTIVSKNDHDTAWARIEDLGLCDYFLCPAIHWGPKSQSLRGIAETLNIGLDTFAVIDDSPFERNEIRSELPQVRVIDPADGLSFIEQPEFDVPATPESRARRLQYQTELRRTRIQASWHGSYDDFLRRCNMIIKIRRPGPDDRARCLELIQRSNQFNLSARRYSAEDFGKLLIDGEHECLCCEVDDDYGGYGIVAVAVFRWCDSGATLIDFVLSCRVAQKRVEETFLLWFANRVQTAGLNELRATLRVTDRNKPLREVLKGLQFECDSQSGDVCNLVLHLPDRVILPDVMRINDRMLSHDSHVRKAA